MSLDRLFVYTFDILLCNGIVIWRERRIKNNEIRNKENKENLKIKIRKKVKIRKNIKLGIEKSLRIGKVKCLE